MPNLATIIVLVPTNPTHDHLVLMDSTANVTLILNNFRFLRQLLIGNPSDESKLSKLHPLSTSADSDKAAMAHSTRRKSATRPAPPAAGSLLEELASQHVYEVPTLLPLPALRSIQSEFTWSASLPVTVTKLVVSGWKYCTDEQLAMVRNLHELNLEIGSNASNIGMDHIANQNPHLRVLRIVQSKTHSGAAISADGLWSILQKCPYLHTVEYKVLSSSSPMSTDGLLQRMCKRAFPNIQHLEYSVGGANG